MAEYFPPSEDLPKFNEAVFDEPYSIEGLDRRVVHKAGTETITGNKTFTGITTLDSSGVNTIQSSFAGIANLMNASAGVNKFTANATDGANYLQATGTNGKNILFAKVNTLYGEEGNGIESNLPNSVLSNVIGNQLKCVGGYNLITSAALSTNANVIQSTGNGSNSMITTGGGNNEMIANGTGRNSMLSQRNNEIIAGASSANLMLVGSSEKLNMTSSTTTLTNPSINLNGALTVTNNGAPGLRLNGNNTDGSYITFYPDGTTRRAYLGYPGLGNVKFTIANEYSNGQLENLINGVVKSVTTTTDTTLTNTAHTITASTGSNTIQSSRTSAYGNVIRALGTGGGNSMTTASGQNLIESGGGGANLIQCLGGSARNTIYTTGNSSTANFIDTFDGTGGNTIRASSGNNTISTTTGTNYIQSSGGDCEMRVTGGIGGVKLTATVGTNPYIGIYGKNIYYDTDNTHYIRTGASPGTVKIQVDGATTTLTNTNQFFTSGDQFTVQCFNNRINVDSSHSLKVGTVEKLFISGIQTNITNASINLSTLKVTNRPQQWLITGGGGGGNGTTTAGFVIGAITNIGSYFSSVTTYGGALVAAWSTINGSFTAPTDGLYRIELNIFQNATNVVGRTLVLETTGGVIPGNNQYMIFNNQSTGAEASFQCSQTLWLTLGQTFKFRLQSGGNLVFYYADGHTTLNIIRIY